MQAFGVSCDNAAMGHSMNLWCSLSQRIMARSVALHRLLLSGSSKLDDSGILCLVEDIAGLSVELKCQ